MVVVELVDGCNLRCALCWNRNRLGSLRQMELTTVEKVLNKYHRMRIDWYNWGEPLLHKRFPTIASMIRGTASCISTNFSLNLPDNYFDLLQNFKIVVVSTSGITEPVYGLYNRGGNFNLVMENIKKLSHKKKTRIMIRWLSHKDNEFQYQESLEYFNSIGYEVEKIALNCEVEELLDGFENPYLKPKENSRERGCPIMRRPTIGVDGQYLLCCASHNVPIGISVFDDFTDEEMINIKMSNDLCKRCREGKHWRMF